MRNNIIHTKREQPFIFSTTKSGTVENSAVPLLSSLNFWVTACPRRAAGSTGGSTRPVLQQLVVGAGFHNALGAKHQDAVVVLDGGQAVGNGQGGAAMGQLFQLCPTRISLSLSSALVASSRIRMGGFFRNTRAMAMRCFWPPESLTPRSRHRCRSRPSGP